MMDVQVHHLILLRYEPKSMLGLREQAEQISNGQDNNNIMKGQTGNKTVCVSYRRNTDRQDNIIDGQTDRNTVLYTDIGWYCTTVQLYSRGGEGISSQAGTKLYTVQTETVQLCGREGDQAGTELR